MEFEISMIKRRFEVVLLQGARVVVAETVDGNDVVAVRQQAIAEMRPNEARGSRD
jgi:hypothetical protein